jgi:transitional endoplasmic reticulum ATPase
MLNPILEIELSLWTLLVASLLPFVYFLYHFRYWYRSDLVRMWDFVLLSISTILGLFLVIKCAKFPEDLAETRFRLLLVLHAIPAGICFLLVNSFKLSNALAFVPRGTSPVKQTKATPDNSWLPAPVGKNVERLSWNDIILDTETKSELAVIVELLRDPSASVRYGVEVPKGVLLSGPPGTGKTTIAKVIANSAGLSFFVLRADEVVSKWVGESEKNLSALFSAAEKHAPSLIFIDEVDSIGSQRSGQQSWKDNLLNHLLTLIDGVVKTNGIHVIAATNRPDLVDSALKRAGRLNRIIEIPLPGPEARSLLFQHYMRTLELEEAIDINALVKCTEGKSGADIKAICNQAGLNAFKREAGNEHKEYKIAVADLQKALEDFTTSVVPDIKRDPTDPHGNYTPAPIDENQVKLHTWDDIIISDDTKTELFMLMELLKDPAAAESYGIEVPKGVLLAGPPGTGKTTIARILAHTAGLTFFALKADEVVSKWVGESEKNLTRLFNTAVKHAPSLIFIDEVDSIGAQRSAGRAGHSDSLLNHLLQLIDGIIKTEGVNIVAATNRPDLVDPALKRGGRLNRVIEIPLPDYNARKHLFGHYLSSLKLKEELNLDILAQLTDGKSGADIKAICNQAGLNAFRRETLAGTRNFLVEQDDMRGALKAFLGTARGN